jgi:hypothetical protein
VEIRHEERRNETLSFRILEPRQPGVKPGTRSGDAIGRRNRRARCGVVGYVLVSRAVALTVVAVLPALSAPVAATSSHAGHEATCVGQSGAGFPGAYTSHDNLVVGPLSMIGAGAYTPRATVREFGGNKFPVLVRPDHTVTVALSRRANRSASLFYGNDGGVLTETRVRDGDRAVTFRACSGRRAQSEADGHPVTFWSGFVIVSKPMCLHLKVWIDAHPVARRAHIALGRRC